MALKVENGVITSPGVTGNQTVTLVDTGFGTVKAVILCWSYQTAEADTGADLIFGIGFGTYRSSTPQQWVAHNFSDDASGTSICAAGQTSASIIRGLSEGATPTLDFDAALVSFGDASFVINWTDLPTTASIKINYLVLGGSDITDALVSTVDVTTGTGTQDITVVAGFGKPDLIFQTMCKGNVLETDEAVQGPSMLGIGKSDTEQGVSCFIDEDARPTMELASFQESDFIGFLGNDTTLSLNAVLTARASWPTDGFQIDKLANSFGASARCGFLALRGSFTSVIGSNTVPITGTPPVTQDLAVGQTPRGAIFFHNVLPTTAGLDNTHADLGLFGLGFMDGTHESWEGVGDDDGAASAITHRHHSESKVIKMFTPAAAGTLTSEADGAFSGTNVRLSWNDIDTVEREYRYLLLGDGAAAATRVSRLLSTGVG